MKNRFARHGFCVRLSVPAGWPVGEFNAAKHPELWLEGGRPPGPPSLRNAGAQAGFLLYDWIGQVIVSVAT
jgi:hypothetical protein